jgi:zinc protease
MIPLTRRTALKGAAASLALPVLAHAQGTPAAPPVLRTARRAPDQPLFGAATWTLDNGLRVVLAENRRAPVAAHYLYVAAGSGEDPHGKSGIAHYLEHMMFKGSRDVPSGVFSRVVAREGGQDNAFTSRDMTAYFQTVETSRLPLMMRMEADRLAAPLMPPDEYEAERSVVLEERRQVIESNPRRRFSEDFDAAMWGRQHWRGRPIIGWEDEIRAITRQDMLDFHARYYRPANCVLVVAGDVREADLRRWAEEFYGPIPSGPDLPRERAAPPAEAGEPRLIRRTPDVREPSFLHAFAAPSATWGEAALSDPLDVLAHLLGGGPGSRIHKALVEEGLAVNAGASHNGQVLGVGSFFLYATPRPGVTTERIEQALNAVVAGLLDGGATEAELRRSIRQETAGALLALDGLGAAPRMLGGALSIGLPLEAVEFWPQRLAAVTLAQVNEAARKVLGAPGVNMAGWLLPGDA